MTHRSDTPPIDWPDTSAIVYRSEAFAEDLDDTEGLDLPPAPGWPPLERLVVAVPLLCIFAPVVDAWFLH